MIPVEATPTTPRDQAGCAEPIRRTANSGASGCRVDVALSSVELNPRRRAYLRGATDSEIEWGAGADAELVALRVGHGDERLVVALADIDPARAQRLEPIDLGFDVGHP